jgi:hypothetical protein
VIEPGTLINECTLYGADPYLQEYSLFFDANNKNRPLIAYLPSHLFNDLLEKTEDECTEKMRIFSHSIPGFELMSRSSAKKMFNFFKFQKVKKGWRMYSYDYMKNGMSSI